MDQEKKSEVSFAEARVRQWAKTAAAKQPPSLLSQAGTTVAKNPWATGIATGGLVAAGLLGRRFGGALLRRGAPRVQRGVQEFAQAKGFAPGYFTKSVSPKGAPTILERVKARVLSGGVEPVYLSTGGEVLPGSIPAAKQRITSGLGYAGAPSRADVMGSGMVTHGAGARKLERKMVELAEAGKVKEISEGMGLSKQFARGGSAKEFSQKYGLTIPKRGDMKAEQKYLIDLQSVLKKEFGGKGFVLKPSGLFGSAGAFPSHKGDWGALYKDYMTRLKPEMEAFAAKIKADPMKYPLSVGNYSAPKFRNDPAYVGTALEAALKSPKTSLAQEMMSVVKRRSGTPSEFRVHLLGGQAPADLAYERYNAAREVMKRIPILKNLRRKKFGTPEEAAAWAQKNVAPNLPEELKKGNFGLDVIRVRKQKGGYDYKLVELNPASEKNTSGFLDTGVNPFASIDQYRWITGRDAPLVAAAKGALGVGAGVGAGVAGAETLG